MPESQAPVAWHLHLCRNAAYWRGGQIAQAHAEFLRLVAQAGRTPVLIKVTVWTDSHTLSCYQDWCDALGLATLPPELQIYAVDVRDDLPNRWAHAAHAEFDEWNKEEALQAWESAVERQIDTASAELKNVFPDSPPPWLEGYQQTQMCLLLAQYGADENASLVL